MKSKRIKMSAQTRANWLIDVAVFIGALLASLTGIYFLFLPSGGYQGGRNPMYGVQIFFERHTWDDLHTWGGVLMIAAAAIHIAIHWKWIKLTARRVLKATLSREAQIPRSVQGNIIINLVIGVSFLLAALSGVYFLLYPSGGYQGGSNPNWDPGFIFSRTTWDLIHTWSGTVMIVAAVLHFAIHWRWVKNVTRRFFLSLWQRPQQGELAATQQA
jgi:hypothetical protein